NSTWTKIDKEFWISNWGWQDARIEIANPGESLVFAVRYQVSPNDEYYFLMDNFSIEAYEPVVFNKVGNSEHFDFYTNIEGEEDYYYNIQDELEKEYSKLSAYWDRPFREKIFDEDVRIKVNFGSKEDIYLCDDKTPNWKCGFHNISTFEIYLSPLTTDIQRSFYTDLKGLAVNEFSQLAIIRKLQRNQIGNFPEYFLEGFGLYETGFRPRVDSVRAYMDGRINPEMSFIEDTTGIATTNKKDVTVSFIEGQLMFGYFNLKPWEDGWFNFVHYFYVNADEERYRCINTSEHFNLYTFPADSVYSQEILDSLEGSFSRYTALYELQINHQWSVVLHSKKSVALDFGYSENTAGSAFGGSAFSVLLIERNPGIFFDDDGKMGIINHEFFHTIANHFNIFNGFYNEGLTTVMSGRPFTEDKLSIHKAIIQNVFDFYEVNYGRYPTMDEFVYDPHRDIDGFKGFDPYVFGSAFFYYIFESYNYLDVKKFILGEGDIEGDYEGAFHKTKEEIEAGYIAYLENIINPTISKPGVVTLSVSQIQAYSAILNGSISSDGGATITQRGFYWSNSNPNPGLGDHVETESGTTGEFSFELTGLSSGTNYYFRAFATNSEGTAFGEVKQFTTLEEATALEELPFSDDFSQNYENWTTVSVTGDDVWHISNDDGIDFGKCARFYPTSNPRQANNDWLVSPVFNTNGMNNLAVTFKYLFTADGASPEFYYAAAFDGNPANSNWIHIDKSFWINDWGWQDARIEIANPGESFVFALRYEVSPDDQYYFLMDNFHIEGITHNQPAIETNNATSITSNSATLNGKLISDGGATITQRGFYWSSSNSNPGSGDHVENVNGTTGEFLFELTDLSAGTTYFYKAFATNIAGTSTGVVMEFTTNDEQAALIALPFTDPFEDDYLNWTPYSLAGEEIWHISPDDGMEGSRCARFYITSNPKQANVDWLISDYFNVAGLNLLEVRFDYFWHTPGRQPEFFYTHDFTGNIEFTNWNHLENNFWSQGKSQWAEAVLEIDNEASQLAFAMQYSSTTEGGQYVLIDNFSIREKGTGVKVYPNQSEEIRVFPNPVSEQTRLEFFLEGADMVTLELYNTNGSKQLVISEQFYHEGWHKLPIGHYFSKPGLYFAKLSSSEWMHTIKLLVQE
ncbi:MAG: T9SS type A sorting domain-containing protein, partial [Prolixibacteraceae bacterium]|nr:T9SS type A sorting domain-containing protein [Prolixibacteraceae bacterium]